MPNNVYASPIDERLLVENSVPKQQLQYANQLTVQMWNDIINMLSVQGNTIINYLRRFHFLMFDETNLENLYNKIVKNSNYTIQLNDSTLHLKRQGISVSEQLLPFLKLTGGTVTGAITFGVLGNSIVNETNTMKISAIEKINLIAPNVTYNNNTILTTVDKAQIESAIHHNAEAISDLEDDVNYFYTLLPDNVSSDNLLATIAVTDAIRAYYDSLIPEQASISNKLADKAFVNSSIATATATFRGTTDVRTLELFTEWLNNIQIKDLNDYVYWYRTDENGNKYYSKYKYDGSMWLFEYNLNNSSFTADQWSSINSGITSYSVTQISINEMDIYNIEYNILPTYNTRIQATETRLSNLKIILYEEDD